MRRNPTYHVVEGVTLKADVEVAPATLSNNDTASTSIHRDAEDMLKEREVAFYNLRFALTVNGEEKS